MVNKTHFNKNSKYWGFVLVFLLSACKFNIAVTKNCPKKPTNKEYMPIL